MADVPAKIVQLPIKGADHACWFGEGAFLSKGAEVLLKEVKPDAERQNVSSISSTMVERMDHLDTEGLGVGGNIKCGDS